MAELKDIYTALISQINSALSAANLSNIGVGSEFPPKKVLQDVGQPGGESVIALVHKMTNYSSKFMRYQESITESPVSLKSELSTTSIMPGQSAILELSEVPISNEAVSLVRMNGEGTEAATYLAQEGDQLSDIASGLATAIGQLSGFTVEASDAEIEITNSGTAGFQISTHVASSAEVQESSEWAHRSMQLIIWSASLTARDSIFQVIEKLLSKINDAGGFALSGQSIELKLLGSRPNHAETDKDVFCDLFLFDLEHSVTVPKQLWGIVAPLPSDS